MTHKIITKCVDCDHVISTTEIDDAHYERMQGAIWAREERYGEEEYEACLHEGNIINYSQCKTCHDWDTRDDVEEYEVEYWKHQRWLANQ